MPSLPPSDYTLIWDSETFTDAAQHRRVIGYQLRKDGELIQRGIAFEPDSLSDAEVAAVQKYCKDRGCSSMPVAAFVHDVFLRYVYGGAALNVLFNQEFDLSRLGDAKPGNARGRFAGGFSCSLEGPLRLRMKHVSRTVSFIDFAMPAKQRASRSMRNRGTTRAPTRGHFVDVATLARAVTGRGHSLRSLARFLETPTQKTDVDLAGPITDELLDYVLNDVEVTWQCFEELRSRFEQTGLTETRLSEVYSEASLGKATLKQMGVRPWRDVRGGMDPHSLARIMSTYYGGRAEVAIRRRVVQVMLLDATSMYPTVAVIMGLWRYVISTDVVERDSTQEVRAFLERVTLDDLRDSNTWRFALHAIAKVRPEGDVFPFRAPYAQAVDAALGADDTPGIGVNHVWDIEAHWWTLADCVASKLLTGRAPGIVEAISFEPSGTQTGLRSTDLLGDPDFRVDPLTGDVFKRLVELRGKAKQRAATTGDKPERERWESHGRVIKAIANSSAYGIFMETLVERRFKPSEVHCYGDGGADFAVRTRVRETTGAHFHPLLGTLATSGARLVLAICERLGLDGGLDWAFCDTDSMAFACPPELSRDGFADGITRVQDWFQPLYPYADNGQFLKVEDVNFSLSGDHQLADLYCFAVAPKRYALFNIVDGKPVIRDASAHGLGHFIAPYGEGDGLHHPTIPRPEIDLDSLGIKTWNHDLWHRIVDSALHGHAGQVDLSDFPNFDQPAAVQYTITTPQLLTWFDTYNEGRYFADQVKPHNFLLLFQQRSDPTDSAPFRGKPVAPFDRDVARAGHRAFDRETGRPMYPRDLKTFADALAQYHLQSEWKFLDAESIDAGRVRRRHVQVCGVIYVGKEADRWEERMHVGDEPEDHLQYGGDGRPVDLVMLRDRIDRLGLRELARQCVTSPAMLSMVTRGQRRASPELSLRIRGALQRTVLDGKKNPSVDTDLATVRVS